MRTQIRIVAGSLRGRKLSCTVNPTLRPTPQMVREALFSILGNAVPGRPFLDVFAGTGVVGLEALSRGAASVVFVERDFRLSAELEQHLNAFGVGEQARIARADVYRWAERWQALPEPVTIFLSPPFIDFERRPDDLFGLVGQLQQRSADGSVLVLQAESSADLAGLPDRDAWDERRYGRNLLLIWVKETAEESGEEAGAAHDGDEREGIRP
jgi:16S rRNA (guanine966-N2)-methyltransferase